MQVFNSMVFWFSALLLFIQTEGQNLTGRSRKKRQIVFVPVPVAVSNFSVPCITCTYANRANCCAYYRRCCGVIAPTVSQNSTSGFCGSSSLYACSQTCLVDAECSPGLKCCPPPPSICVVPYQQNQCPLSVPANSYLQSCDPLFGCQANEFCCPNPFAKGCCVQPATANPNIPLFSPGKK